MTSFRYRAARPDGSVVRGDLEAPSPSAAAALLSSRSLYPFAIEVATRPLPLVWRRPSVRAQATAFRSLASLLDAGVPLERTIEATLPLVEGRLRDALARTGNRVREGDSLSKALGAEQEVFSQVAVGLVRAGERGVGLAAALDQAATQLEANAQAAGRIRAALAYPVLLAVMGAGSVAFIVGFMVPRFAALLTDAGQALPGSTRALMGVAEAAPELLVLSAVAVAAMILASQRTGPSHRWDEWVVTLPLIGAIRHGLATARVARTLGALLGVGTPALLALQIARDASGERAIARRLDAARDLVVEGVALSVALERTRALTHHALQLAAIGEGSGRLPIMLQRAAAIEEEDSERRLRSLIGLLEPTLIVVFAGIIALIAAALLQAVYALRPA